MEPLDVPPGAVAARVVGVFVVASDVLRGVGRREEAFREYAPPRSSIWRLAKTRSVSRRRGSRRRALFPCAERPRGGGGRASRRACARRRRRKPRAIRGGVRGDTHGDARDERAVASHGGCRNRTKLPTFASPRFGFVRRHVRPSNADVSRDERVDRALRRAGWTSASDDSAAPRPRLAICAGRAGWLCAHATLAPGEDSWSSAGSIRARGKKTKTSRRSDRTSSSFARPPPRTFPDKLARAVRDAARDAETFVDPRQIPKQSPFFTASDARLARREMRASRGSARTRAFVSVGDDASSSFDPPAGGGARRRRRRRARRETAEAPVSPPRGGATRCDPHRSNRSRAARGTTDVRSPTSPRWSSRRDRTRPPPRVPRRRFAPSPRRSPPPTSAAAHAAFLGAVLDRQLS